MKSAISFLLIAMFCQVGLSADTGWISPSVVRQISNTGNSSPSQVKYGKVPGQTFQGLFKYDVVLPEFALVTNFEYQFRTRRPCFSAQLSQINKSWNGSSTWNSLGSGLSGSEIGVAIAGTPVASGFGTISFSGEAAAMVPVMQAYSDGQGFFDGVVAHGLVNSGVTDGMIVYDIKITYLERLGGDTDLDGDVDFEDFLEVSRNYESGPGKTWADGDFTGDGEVLFEDFLILSANFDG